MIFPCYAYTYIDYLYLLHKMGSYDQYSFIAFVCMDFCIVGISSWQ